MLKYLNKFKFTNLMNSKKGKIKIKYDKSDENEEMETLTPKQPKNNTKSNKSKLDYLKEYEAENKKPQSVKIEKRENRDNKAEYPPLFFETWKLIEKMRIHGDAPVDTVGADCCPDKSAPKDVYNFQTLVSLLLSSQTKDQQTYNAMQRLIKHGLDIDNIRKTSESDIKELIYGVSFHNNKAKYLKSVSAE